MTLCALLLSMAGATLLYLASAQQKLLPRTLGVRVRVLALALQLGGLAAWQTASGIGAGMAAALTASMLTWVVLPYIAWWRTPSQPARSARARTP